MTGLYACARLSGRAVTLHEVMTEQGGIQKGPVRQQLVKNMASNLLQVCANMSQGFCCVMSVCVAVCPMQDPDVCYMIYMICIIYLQISRLHIIAVAAW